MVTVRWIDDESDEWIDTVEMPCVPQASDTIDVGVKKWRVLPGVAWKYEGEPWQWTATIHVHET